MVQIRRWSLRVAHINWWYLLNFPTWTGVPKLWSLLYPNVSYGITSFYELCMSYTSTLKKAISNCATRMNSLKQVFLSDKSLPMIALLRILVD